jgi:peptidoglycan/xylan/chitin deacetylase (PgdA/CDA1 family)
LAYHRIDDADAPGFDTFKPNVSASPELFAQQMDYINKRFSVISIKDLLGWINGDKRLPKYPLLITFDDGYADNYTNAHPILERNGFPTVIFLATGCIGKDTPFFWDLAAYCFAHTKLKKAEFPLIGEQTWDNEIERDRVLEKWNSAIKWLPYQERELMANRLLEILQVTIPQDAFSGLYMTWNQVRQLARRGVDMGAHTENHPILTKISIERVKNEFASSKKLIMEKTGQSVESFAYPNGLSSDFNNEIVDIVREEGFKVAFTLLPGPCTFEKAREAPLEIPRVYIGREDTLPRFVAKVSGLYRLFGGGY